MNLKMYSILLALLFGSAFAQQQSAAKLEKWALQWIDQVLQKNSSEVLDSIHFPIVVGEKNGEKISGSTMDRETFAATLPNLQQTFDSIAPVEIISNQPLIAKQLDIDGEPLRKIARQGGYRIMLRNATGKSDFAVEMWFSPIGELVGLFGFLAPDQIKHVVAKSPNEALALFAKAISQKDKATAQGLCTRGYWQAKRDSGARFYDQAVRKNFVLQIIKTEKNEDRAVHVVNVMIDDKAVDTVFVYLVKDRQRWLLDGANEVGSHPQHFIDHRVSGHFDPDSLPSIEEVGTLAGIMLQASHGEAAQRELLQYLEDDKRTRQLVTHLYGKDNLRVVRNVYSEKLMRAAIHFQHTSDPGWSDFILYCKRAGDKWQIYQYSYSSDIWLSSFLSD